MDSAIAVASENVAAPSEAVLLPLAKLRASAWIVRRTAPALESIEALAQSIARLGLLQNLVVVHSVRPKHGCVSASS